MILLFTGWGGSFVHNNNVNFKQLIDRVWIKTFDVDGDVDVMFKPCKLVYYYKRQMEVLAIPNDDSVSDLNSIKRCRLMSFWKRLKCMHVMIKAASARENLFFCRFFHIIFFLLYSVLTLSHVLFITLNFHSFKALWFTYEETNTVHLQHCKMLKRTSSTNRMTILN